MIPRIESEFVRYIIGGIANTLFGYGVFVSLYMLLAAYIHYLVILLINFFISVAFAFIIMKIFVFRSTGNGIRQYLRSNLVYLVGLIANAGLLVVLVEYLQVRPLVAQAICLAIIAAFTYVIHKKFTFSETN